MPRRLLAVLLAYRNSVVSTDRLVEVLWDEAPESAAATLQSYVSRLRRFVELRRRRHAGEPRARLRARGPRHRGRRRSLRGRPGRGPRPARPRPRPGPRPARRRARRVAGRRLRRVRRDRVDPARGGAAGGAAAGRGRGCASTPSCAWVVTTRSWARSTALLVDHPLREQFARQAMLALYRVGRQAEALRVAQQFRTTLRDDLGLEPSAQLRDLEAAILDARDDLAWVPPDVPSARQHRAPAATRSRWRPPRSSGASATSSSPGACSRPDASSRCSVLAAWARRASRTGSRAPSPTSSPTACDWSSSRPVRDEGAVTAAVRGRARCAATAGPHPRRVDRRAAGLAVGAARARQLRARARHHQ